jgi:hypothetical protein
MNVLEAVSGWRFRMQSIDFAHCICGPVATTITVNVSKPPSTFNARAETVAERPMLLNPFADRVFKFRDIMEHASSDALARDLGEEPLDEIDPRAGCWGEVELETLLPGEPALHLLCLVRSAIVDDEMQIEADGSLAVDLPEELQVFVCPVARQALRTDATSVHSLAQYSLAGTLGADAF